MKFINSEKNKPGGTIILIPCDSIRLNPNHPRKNCDESELSLFASSVSKNGIIQPLIVRRIGLVEYELITGMRRLLAAKSVGLATVPCILMSAADCDSIIYSLLENIQREDLMFFDIADSISELISVYGLNQSEIASRLGKSQPWLFNKLRIAALSDNIRRRITDNNLTERHARAILLIKSEEEKHKALDYIIKKGLNVNETDKYIASIINPVKKPAKPKINKLKDIKIFINTINHAVDTMRKAGIKADSHETETPEYYEYVVRIPKTASSPVSLKPFSENAV